MTPENWLGIYVFLGMFVMIMLGFPIYLSMFAMAAAGFFAIGGPTYAITQFLSGPFNLSATYNFAVLPLFMLLGVLAGDTGVAGDTFTAARKWTGKVRGGLLMSTVVANLIFGACSGMSAAANIVFGKIAYPELRRNGYESRLAIGCITATGALSSLIPPSTTIVLFAMLAEISVGTALMSGILPGIAVAVLYCIAIVIIGKVQPYKVPAVTEADKMVTGREKLGSLKLLLPIVALFAIIIGGIYGGVFPATVGGAIGAFAIIVYAFAKRLSPRMIWKGIREATIMNAQVFPIIIAGSMFSRLVALSGLATGLAKTIANAELSPFVVMLLVIVFYLFCGCVMDMLSTLIITVPLVFPLLMGLGYNEFVICIILVFMMEIAGLTPPIGMNVFNCANVLRMNPMEIFKGVVPFFVVDIIMVFLLIIFPQIVTFLPSLLSS